MKTLEPYFLSYDAGVITTIFHTDDRLSKQELLDEFKKYELPFSCLRVNVGYFTLEDQINHKLTCKCYYNCQGYQISTSTIQNDHLHLYHNSLRKSNCIFITDALNKQNDSTTVVLVIDPDWQPLTFREMYILTVEKFGMWMS